MTADIKWGDHVTASGRQGVAMDVEPSRVFVRFEDMSGRWYERCAVVAGWPLTPAEEGEKASREEAVIAVKTERAAVLLAKAMADEQVELFFDLEPGDAIELVVEAMAVAGFDPEVDDTDLLQEDVIDRAERIVRDGLHVSAVVDDGQPR
jgi:hypothetical protein